MPNPWTAPHPPEKNVIRKQWKADMLKIALVYPNAYSAMAGLTVQTLYSLWNGAPNVLCERFFLPSPVSKLPLGHRVPPLNSIENGMPLTQFDIIAFTFSYELDYPHLCWVLENAGVPLKRSHRNQVVQNTREGVDIFPLIIAGGAAIRSNPFPLEPFFDAFFIGEIEPANDAFISAWFEALNSRQNTSYPLIQADFLAKCARIGGFWVPAFHSLEIPHSCIARVYSKNLSAMFHPIVQIQAERETHIQTKRHHAPAGSEESPFPSNIAFPDSFFLEIARGCPYSCNFCMTGNQIKPYRLRSLANLEEILSEARKQTEFSKVVLIGSSVTDHPQIKQLLAFIIGQGLEFSLPSVRADRLNKKTAELIKLGGNKTVTIAPEAGSDSLRRKLNKKITNSQIIEGVQILRAAGIPTLKLYFIVGFPEESEADIEAIISLVENICDLGYQKNAIRLSINPFIPKAHTPFELAVDAYLDPKMTRLKVKYRYLADAFSKMPQVKADFLPLWEAYLQFLFALGNESFSSLISIFYNAGMNPKQWYRLVKKPSGEMLSAIKEYLADLKSSEAGKRPWNRIVQIPAQNKK